MVEFVILAALFFGLFFISANAEGLDYLSPSVVLPAVFFVCSLAAIYNSALYGVEISWIAVLALLGTTALFSAVANLCSSTVLRRGSYLDIRVKNAGFVPREIEYSNVWLAVTVIYCCLVLLLYYRDLMRTFGSLGLAGDWNQNMNAYRFASSFKELDEGEGISGMTNLLFKVETAITFVYMYVGVQDWVVGAKKRALPCFLPLLIHCVCVVLSAGRMGMIRVAFGFAAVAWVLWNANTGWSRRIKLSTILKCLAAFLVACVAFWVLGVAVGRQIDEGPFDYVASYIGYSMVLFSRFLDAGDFPANGLFGSETFVGLYNFIGSHFGITDFVYTNHLEWQYFQGIQLGNVYTAYRYWLHDFGTVGMLIMATLYGVFYSVIYGKAKGYRKSDSLINYPLLMFSYFAYGVVLIPIMDGLCATELVVTTPMVLIIMYVMGRLLASKQERI